MQHKLAAAMNRQTKLSRSPIYAIRLQARPGTDGIRALRAVLKVLWRQHQLRCLDAREVQDGAARCVYPDLGYHEKP
jgi:hypothetical protein